MENFTGAGENSPAARTAEMLAGIPPLQQLLEHERVAQLCQRFRREDIAAVLRTEIQMVRQKMLAGEKILPDFISTPFFDAIEKKLQHRHGASMVRVINATGVALHTNLGRAPLAPQAVAAISEAAAGYCNLEFDLEQGERSSREAHVDQLLCRLTGAEAALVVNNCAAAVLLCLSALARDSEVLVSRGELVEIGGAFRMPDVIAQSGARMVEVGTTNRTTLADYRYAVSGQARIILKCHPSNYRIVGFSCSPERSELAQLAQEHHLLFIEDLGSGTLVDLRRYGLPHEPTVQECVRAGADVITFSGDKLLGGPQAGIIVGRRKVLDTLRKHPLLRALRIDKLSLAALEATLRLYELPEPPEQHVPLLQTLALQQHVLERRARRLARELKPIPGITCMVQRGVSLAGGGSLPGTGLPTSVVKVRAQDCSAAQLARRLRRQKPALVARVADDWVLLDLRTLAPDEVRMVAPLVAAALK